MSHSVPASNRSPVLGCAFAISFMLNVVALLAIFLLCLGYLFRSVPESTTDLQEKFFSGSKSATSKVAVVTLEGAIMEGMLDHVKKQIEQTGKDDNVKATVLRVNSPGGTITASDDLHRRLTELVKGNQAKEIIARPLVVSMDSIAASGGYYVAMPAGKIFAERTTITGSIGVYASFPNVKELADKWGIAMNTLKAGQIKDAGSMFQTMSPAEQQMLQDMVDDAYVRFLNVVTEGRPALTREKLLERFTVKPLNPDPQAGAKKVEPYTRYRADGGIFSSEKAKELGLIDDIGTLEDAVKAAAALANLDAYRAIRYVKPKTFSDYLIGVQAPSSSPSGSLTNPQTWQNALTPKLWYLAPGHEAMGLLAEATTTSNR